MAAWDATHLSPSVSSKVDRNLSSVPYIVMFPVILSRVEGVGVMETRDGIVHPKIICYEIFLRSISAPVTLQNVIFLQIRYAENLRFLRIDRNCESCKNQRKFSSLFFFTAKIRTPDQFERVPTTI